MKSIVFALAVVLMASCQPKMTTTESGLSYEITKQGLGEQPQVGDKVKVHYTGTLTDSARTKFDSS